MWDENVVPFFVYGLLSDIVGHTNLYYHNDIVNNEVLSTGKPSNFINGPTAKINGTKNHPKRHVK